MTPTPDERILPFAALVGQDELKLALQLLAVNPRLGGLLVRGHKGTAKSTAARSLAALLPPVAQVEGCEFGCPAARPNAWCSDCRAAHSGSAVPTIEQQPPFVTLPLGVTEDQLLGSIDLERALIRGEQRFSPGILAKVNQGVLYVDEVNLLDDHIVDLLLDAAAMGVNTVAREGIRIRHPAEFALVGTMNPEEGDLRPQLLDRFGLCVEIRSIEDVEQRAEIVSRCLAFEADPARVHHSYAAEQRATSERIAHARQLLPGIEPERQWCRKAAQISLAVGVDGHRADLLMVKAAATAAALAARTRIEEADIERAAAVVLPHRLQRQPFDDRPMAPEQLRARAREALASASADGPPPTPAAEKKK